MNLYRITHSNYADDLTGTGGLYGPGRWHREGTRIVYMSERISLAKLEVLANTRMLPRNQSLVIVTLPDKATILAVEKPDLPDKWEITPYMPTLTEITERWIREGQFWIMRVPSAQSPTEYNYLINPLHSEHATLTVVSIEPHPFDSRLK